MEGRKKEARDGGSERREEKVGPEEKKNDVSPNDLLHILYFSSLTRRQCGITFDLTNSETRLHLNLTSSAY